MKIFTEKIFTWVILKPLPNLIGSYETIGLALDTYVKPCCNAARFCWNVPINIQLIMRNTPLNRGCDLCACFVRPQNRPSGRWRYKGGRKFALVVQGWHRGRSDLAMDAMVTVKFQTVAQRSTRRPVAHRSLKGGKRKAHASPWLQNGCTGVGHWSPRKMRTVAYIVYAMLLPLLYHHCASFGRLIASIERSPWRPLFLHSVITATLETSWQWFCLYSASFARPVVPLYQSWWFQERTRVVLQQFPRNRPFCVWATIERPGQFSGRSKVTRVSQPCVKGGGGGLNIGRKLVNSSHSLKHLKLIWGPNIAGSFAMFLSGAVEPSLA